MCQILLIALSRINKLFECIYLQSYIQLLILLGPGICVGAVPLFVLNLLQSNAIDHGLIAVRLTKPTLLFVLRSFPVVVPRVLLLSGLMRSSAA